MGNIPLVIAGRSAVTAVPETQANPDAFGASVGRAVQGLGETIQQAGSELAVAEREKAAKAKADADKEKARLQDAQYADAIAQSDPTPLVLDARTNAPPDGAGVYKQTSEAYDQFIVDQANKITDPEVRQKFINTMKLRKPDILSGQASFENIQREAYGKDQANVSLDALTNKLRSDPSEATFNTVVADGINVINGRPISQDAKDTLAIAWRENSAYSRFQGMLANAKSLTEFDAIEKELTAKDSPWQARMKPAQFDQTLDQVASARNAFGTAADAKARAMIEQFQARSKDGGLIPPEEIRAGQELVNQAKNSLLQVQFARIARDQEILVRSKDMPPAELNRLLDANKNGPLPGLPAEASAAVNGAAGRFDVSSGYLAGTVTREYGGEFVKPSPAAVAYLTPRAGGHNVSGLDANFADRGARAVAAAEAATGEKATILSGFRSPEEQAQLRANYEQKPVTYKGVVYTPKEKGGLAAKPGESRHGFGQAMDIAPGKVLDWLHVHAAEYGLEFLKGSAFASDPVHMQLAKTAGGGINYGKGTQGSSAVGAFQFQPETWLGIMHDGKTPQRFGLDVKGKTDAELLELRKNLDISANMAAAYAEQNKPILAKALGRSPTDSELYMAHFLGPTGAVTLLKVWQENPNAIAANLVPEAAKANHNVFYDKKNVPFTVDQVYHNVGASFGAAPDQVAYGDQQTYEGIRDRNTAAIQKDFIQFNRDAGRFNMGNLDDPGGYAARGQAFRTAAEFYSVAIPDGKPFSVDEAAAVNKAYKEGNVDEQVAILANIQAMGTDVARAAYKQLGETNPTMEHAATLKANGFDAEARDVLEGQKRIDTPDPRTKIAIEGQNATSIASTIDSYLQSALSRADPKFAAAVGKAAIAHYVNTYVAGAGQTNFNPDALKKSVDAVLGGAVGNVNGAPTVLPKGMTEDKFNRAVNNLTEADLVSMSADKSPPLYRDGTVMTPQEIADEGRFKAIGGDHYQIQLGDGTIAISGVTAKGVVIPYVFVADPKVMLVMADRKAPAGQPTPNPVLPGTNIPQRSTPAISARPPAAAATPTEPEVDPEEEALVKRLRDIGVSQSIIDDALSTYRFNKTRDMTDASGPNVRWGGENAGLIHKVGGRTGTENGLLVEDINEIPLADVRELNKMKSGPYIEWSAVKDGINLPQLKEEIQKHGNVYIDMEHPTAQKFLETFSPDDYRVIRSGAWYHIIRRDKKPPLVA